MPTKRAISEQFRLLLEILGEMKAEIIEDSAADLAKIKEEIKNKENEKMRKDWAANLTEMNEKITANFGDMREEMKNDMKEIIDDKLATIEARFEDVKEKFGELDKKILYTSKDMSMQNRGRSSNRRLRYEHTDGR